jgi:hypothetical protein
VKRYFSLIPVVILITTACDQKAPQVTPLPRMVKAVEVTAVGDSQQRIFPARIESGDSTDLSFKRGGQVESLDVRQGANITQGQVLARSTPGKPNSASMNDKLPPRSRSGSSIASRPWPAARLFRKPKWTSSAPAATRQMPR